MKKMIQRAISLVAALTLILSITAVTCSAEYSSSEDEYVKSPLQEEWFDGTSRD